MINKYRINCSLELNHEGKCNTPDLKQFYYLCGLPRAGNTLFSSIMNQNPKVAVTANSMVADIFIGAEMLKKTDMYSNYPDEQSLDNITTNVIPNYYSHWKEDYIIDRTIWGSPSHFEVLKKYAPNKIKVIVLVRDIKEILASFIKFSYSTKDNYIAREGDTIQERCDYIMANDGSLHKWISAVYNLTRPENKEYIHLIEYDDLVKHPKEEIDKVYDYLYIEPFEHRFTDLNQLENNGIKYDDSEIGEGLHTIKEDKVEKTDYDMWDYLPKNVDEQYRLDPFWRDNYNKTPY
jgi:sulfotransferase